MRDSSRHPRQLSYNRSIRLGPSSHRLSSDAGALMLRELDERLGFTKALASRLKDPRRAGSVEHSLGELLRSRLYLMGQGWHDQRDADRLRRDPALCAAVADGRGAGAADSELASQSTQSRLIDTLSLLPNRGALRAAPTDLAIRCQQLRSRKPLPSFTLDLDSTDLETHGTQQGANYNGYFGHRCYHPLVAFVGETGDLVGAWLRPGNVASVRGASLFALRLLDELEGPYGKLACVRGDSAFATRLVMDRIEERGAKFVFRLQRNPALEKACKRFVKRPPGPLADEVREWTHELDYESKSWMYPHRVVLVVVDDPKDRFMDAAHSGLRTFCLVTNYTADEMPAEELLAHFRQRGTTETRLGEFKNEFAPLLSSSRLAENAATFLLAALAYQLTHMLRWLTTKLERRDEWYSITAFRERFLKVAARFTSGQRRVYAAIADTAWATWQRIFTRLAPT